MAARRLIGDKARTSLAQHFPAEHKDAGERARSLKRSAADAAQFSSCAHTAANPTRWLLGLASLQWLSPFATRHAGSVHDPLGHERVVGRAAEIRALRPLWLQGRRFTVALVDGQRARVSDVLRRVAEC